MQKFFSALFFVLATTGAWHKVQAQTVVGARRASQAVNLTVRSTGRANGALADFFIDGEKLNVNTGRGLNVALLSSSGEFQSFQVFDTHAAGNDALINFFGDLAPGEIVMVAAEDDAESNISTAAISAIQSVGANLIDDMTYRGAYALIGIKNGIALDEQTFPDSSVVPDCSNCLEAVATASYTNVAAHDIIVNSSGRDLGNVAEFYIDGVKLNFEASRGMNVAVVLPGGILESSRVFDTNGLESEGEALADFLEGLDDLKLVLIATKDDARDNLNERAFAAIEDLGATKIRDLTWRDAYALIGVKGGYALSEALYDNGEAMAVARATYDPDAVEIRTTTTTTLPPCYFLDCPIGFALKGFTGGVAAADFMNIRGKNSTECCDAKASTDLTDVGVRSAGFSDGSEAVFFAGGVAVHSSTQTGLTVVTLRQDATAESAETFNTMQAGSDALVRHLDSLKNGQLVLIGAANEASSNISEAAMKAIEGLGATKIREIGWRSGYALVGIKGGQAISEMVKAENEGYAVAVGEMEIIIQVDLNKPVCEARVANPPVLGYVSMGNLELEAGCRYRIFEREHAADCLSGSWTVITGSSNTLLEFGNLINMLAPDEYGIDRPGESIGASAVADVIIENGQVTHWDVVSNKLEVCIQEDKAIAQQNDAACRAAIKELLDKAPAYSSSAIRITMFISFFWDRTSVAMDMVSENAAWSEAPISLVTQVGAWYNVCSVTKEDYCTRPELLEMEKDDAIQVFKEEMEAIMVKFDSFCGVGGRAHELGCNVQTISWTNGQRDNENFRIMNAYIVEAMESRSSPSLRLIDFFNLGGGMSNEVINGHGSQMLNLWVWQVMFNAMCPDASQAAEKSWAQWDGVICSGTEAKYENCPDYYPACELGPRCERWECMNSVPCTLRAVDPPNMASTEGICSDAIDLSNFLGERRLLESTIEPCFNSQGLRTRLWCGGEYSQWVLPSIFVILAIFVEAWPKMEPHLRKRLGLPEKAGDKRMAPAKPAQPAAEVQPPVESRDFMLLTSTLPPLERSGPSSKSIKSHKTEPGSPAVTESDTVALDLGSVDQESTNDETASATKASGGGDEVVVAVTETPEPAKEPEKAATKEPEKAIEGTSPEKPAPQTCLGRIRLAGNKYPLGLARFAASSHVVIGHLAGRSGVIDREHTYFAVWGFTWVPWFFMLSGFVLFSAYLKNPKEESMFQYAIRRSVTIYPLYAVSLIPTFAAAKALGKMAYATSPDALTMIAQSFLLQAWWPGWTERALQPHCWFLSCMVVYWVLFKPLAYCLKNLTLLKTVGLMAFLMLLPWFTIFIPLLAQESVNWHKEHTSDFIDLQTDTALDFGVVMLKFHWVCYLHVFMLGMLLARLRQLLDAKATAAGPVKSWRNPWNIALQFIAPTGYLFLLLIFGVEGFQRQLWGYRLSARLSVLLPFQAMILFGLAGLPSFPLPVFSWIFSQFDFLENYSFAVYVFQWRCYEVWPKADMINLTLFMLFVYSSAVVIARCIQAPVQKWWANHPIGRCIVPFVLATTLVSLNVLIPNPTAELSQIPATKRLDERMLDLSLGLLDAEGAAEGAAVINPSITIQGDKVVVSARRHWTEVTQKIGTYNGQSATIIEDVWHSEVLMGSAPLDAEAWANWPLENSGNSSGRRLSVQPLEGLSLSTWSGLRTKDGSSWQELCIKSDVYFEHNNTLMRLRVTGPEDPKLIAVNDSISIIFNSLPPSEGDVSNCRRNPNTGALSAVTQMYVASGINPSDPAAEVTGHILAYGQTEVPEKNWVPFTKDGALHFVYTPIPHVILDAKLDGASSRAYDTSFKPLADIVKAYPNIAIRGSADAVYINDPDYTPNQPRPHYLAVLHLHDENTNRYAHFAYRFQAEAPFAILQLSKQLPLTEAEATAGGVHFAFASGLTVRDQTVAITYGAGDRDARALVMTLDRLDEMFDCQSGA
mmetsp:Transcript_81365/g.143597  ORF Transcript_81365/g.143597 Transcript_81365/m.143597 type:complete len:1943 (-) Transcript_81365:182-6010(-)